MVHDVNRALVALGVVIVLLVAALAIVPAFVDWNDYKPEFAARVEAATGRKLTIEGDLSLSVLPAPVLAARSVRLANVEGAVAPDMASAESIEVALQLGPLLRGRIAFSTITLVDPVIELEVLADGRRNWVLAAPDGAGGGAGGADRRRGPRERRAGHRNCQPRGRERHPYLSRYRERSASRHRGIERPPARRLVRRPIGDRGRPPSERRAGRLRGRGG